MCGVRLKDFNIDQALLSSVVILNLSGTNLKSDALRNLTFTSLQFLNLSSQPPFNLSIVSDPYFPTLKELFLSYTPLLPT